MERDDQNAIRAGIQSLQNATYALSQQAYAQQQGGKKEPNADDENVVEGEFTEV